MKPGAGFIAAAALLFGAQAHAHEFIVYFPFDSASVPPGWSTLVVKDAACYGRLPGAREVRVVAHTDLVGPAEYNAALSERRARAVAEMLIAAGVDPGRVTVEAHGDTRRAVAGGDEVNEPLNRRATIQHRFDGAPGPMPPGCEELPTMPKPPRP